jgi:predicted outer membrane repeat protein
VYRNQGLQSRGVAILSERGTRVEIKHCIFTRNSSADLGGAIFNRGTMVISDSLFLENGGKVSKRTNEDNIICPYISFHTTRVSTKLLLDRALPSGMHQKL